VGLQDTCQTPTPLISPSPNSSNLANVLEEASWGCILPFSWSSRRKGGLNECPVVDCYVLYLVLEKWGQPQTEVLNSP
jgi:hypothetical protein